MSGKSPLGWALVLTQMALLAALVLLPDGSSWEPAGIVGVVAWVLMVAGLLLVLASAFQLGKALSAHPEPPPSAVLRTDGLYRWVRHPIYSGLLLLGAGLAADSGNPLAALVFVLLVALLGYKAKLEERLLRQRFPEYAEYASRTPAFVPRPPAPFL